MIVDDNLSEITACHFVIAKNKSRHNTELCRDYKKWSYYV